MPAKCPNCLTLMSRDSSGDYPPKCPSCGVRLRSKTKKPAEVAASPTPAAEERVVRSFSASRKSAPAALEQPTPKALPPVRPTAPETPQLPPVQEEPNPFAPASILESPPISSPEPPAFQLPQPESSPFAASPAAPVVEPPPPLDANPFGGSAPVAAPKKRSAANVVKWTIIGVFGVAAAGLAGWAVYRQRLEQPKNAARPGFHNPDRGYMFYALDGSWKEDKGRAARAGYDLAFHRKDLNAWVTIRTLEPQEDWDLKTATEEAGKLWPDRLKDFSAGPLFKTKLAGREAMAVKGEGTLDGVKTQGQTYCVARDGVVYHLGFEAPSEYYSLLEGDFAKARQHFEFVGVQTDGKREIGSEALVTFASKKFPYRMSGVGKQWREAPDLQTDSRFDDLKLIDRTRAAEVTVAPRETADLPGMRVRYVETQKRRYDNKVRELENAAESLEINGRKALRTLLVATTSGGDFLFFTTFVKGDGLVFQVQCRAPVEKRDVFEPLFAKLVDTFEVLDKAPEPPKQPPTDEPKPKSDDKPQAETQTAPPTATKSPTPEMKPPAEKPAPKEEKKPEPKKDEKKPDAPTKKKKSLDDLD